MKRRRYSRRHSRRRRRRRRRHPRRRRRRRRSARARARAHTPMYGNCSCSLSALTYERNLTSRVGATPEFRNEITSPTRRSRVKLVTTARRFKSA